MSLTAIAPNDPYVRIDVTNSGPDTVRIALVNERDNTGTWVELDGANIEGLISRLSEARAKLNEQVPKTLEPNFLVGEGHFQKDPDWHFHDSITWKGEKLSVITPLALRHEGLGWILFAFPNESAKVIGETLVERSLSTQT